MRIREYQPEIKMNKAGYVTTQIACEWSSAMIGKNNQAKCQTIQRTNMASYRVAYVRLKRL